MPPDFVKFAEFELDSARYELRKNGRALRIEKIPMELLLLLVRANGHLVTRKEIEEHLWGNDVFVDTERGINTAVRKIRQALDDDPDSPRFVQTVQRKGYRFIAALAGPSEPEPRNGDTAKFAGAIPALPSRDHAPNIQFRATLVQVGAMVLVVSIAGYLLMHYRRASSIGPRQHALTRITFDSGLQIGATWSPDGRFIAYSSDRGGKFDIWVTQVSGGDPVQVTHGPSQNWQPNWSPDGKYIAYRSEEGEGGIYVVPALGGAGLARKVASLGYYPRWSPDGSQILLRTTQYLGLNRFYVVGVDGGEPREVLTQFHTREDGYTALAAAWHPDGKRISVWVPSAHQPDFWTVPLAGGAVAARSEFTAEVAKQLNEAGFRGLVEWAPDFNFSWSPSGRALYCALTFRGAVNLWKMTVDPGTLRLTAAERLTTGPGPDGGVAVSPDGRKLAFTAQNQHIGAWLFPFDATRGKLQGSGKPASPDAITVWRLSLSSDGKKLAFSGNRSGRSEIWQRSLFDDASAPVMADDRLRDQPRWSRDGEHLAYERLNFKGDDDRLVLWSAGTHNEELLSDATNIALGLDWSPKGDQVLVSQKSPSTHQFEIWLLPVPTLSSAEASNRKMLSDPTCSLYQPNFSPDGRWIAFQAVKDLHNKLESTLYVAPGAGGSWIRITDGKHWDDKPRWSPDGRTIYFISGRSGFFNVWGIHFDPLRGEVLGGPFAVTKFDSAELMMPEHEPSVDLSITQDKLAVTLEQVSGGIWILDNVDQ